MSGNFLFMYPSSYIIVYIKFKKCHLDLNHITTSE